MDTLELESQFSDIGGQFLTSGFDINRKLASIKAYLFDWDGVFNDGSKIGAEGSGYSEVDSSGIRLLRYAHAKKYQAIPKLGLITGANNPVATDLFKSLSADSVYQRSIQKRAALFHFCEQHKLSPNEVCYVYDDVLDLSVAQEVGLRFCIGRLANPIFLGLVAGSNLADYITATQGNETCRARNLRTIDCSFR